MVRLASVLALALIGGLQSASAFVPTTSASNNARGQSTSLDYYPDNTFLNYQQGGDFPEPQHDIALAYDRAMDCANNFGMCDIDELLDLSEGEFSLQASPLPVAPRHGIGSRLSNDNFFFRPPYFSHPTFYNLRVG